jgi:hypothetical protein
LLRKKFSSNVLKRPQPGSLFLSLVGRLREGTLIEQMIMISMLLESDQLLS